MPVIQEAVDLSAGRNFIPNRMRYRLPMSKTNNSVFLLSDSYEYDIELIKKIPPPKTDYKQIVIPFKVIDKIEVKPFRYIMTQNEFNKKLTYLEDQKLLPKLIPIRYPYPKTIENNIYIPISEIFKMVTPYLRQMPIQKIKVKIFSLFNQIMFHFNWSRNKILVIDVTRFPVYQTLNMDTYKSDLINALLTAYMFNPPDTIKKMDWTIVFRAPDVDYKFDLRTWDKRDLTLLRNMLKAIGKPNATTAKTNEEAGESVDDFMGTDDEVEDRLYEGCMFCISKYENFCYITYGEMKYLLHELKHIDMIALSLHLINTVKLYDQLEEENIEVKPLPAPKEEDYNKETTKFVKMEMDNTIPEI